MQDRKKAIDVLFIKRRVTVLFWSSKTNLKPIVVSSIGLVIAISILATCFYYFEFTRKDYYLGLFEEEGVDQENRIEKTMRKPADKK
ncbi:MAG: hypothetical protein ACFFD4_21590 [Candidatus Odinarchaeota archaeon]